ncbi:MAG: copper homeostasis membrane protein CopD [Allosphingosinicella sp.]|uniref:copper homeostasis membrane protein CopD n=1 Tax=Allosphingosinicella sp. TaxID=2823234 RepID=UPI003935A0E5
MIAWGAGEGVLIALRFLVYADLLLLAGLVLCGGRTAPQAAPSRGVVALAAAGLLLTIAQFAAACLLMVGGDVALLDTETVRFIALETGTGLSSLARVGLLALLAVLAGRDIPVPLLHSAVAVAALATLAWSGHAGAGEGAQALVHRIADVIHLLAAAIWIGTLVLLLVSIRNPAVSRASLAAALQRFSIVGTIVVALLIVTGLVNLWAIAGLDASSLVTTDYGRVLLAKLLLFAAMLGFAALNRWRYTPMLVRQRDAPTAPLRRSLGMEMSLALAVLAAVALLGTLSPG